MTPSEASQKKNEGIVYFNLYFDHPINFNQSVSLTRENHYARLEALTKAQSFSKKTESRKRSKRSKMEEVCSPKKWKWCKKRNLNVDLNSVTTTELSENLRWLSNRFVEIFLTLVKVVS